MAMFTIRFRLRGAAWRRKNGLSGPRIAIDTASSDGTVEVGDEDEPVAHFLLDHRHLSMESFVDDPFDENAPPHLLEDSLDSSWSDEEDDISSVDESSLNSCSLLLHDSTTTPTTNATTPAELPRRVRFLLPTETDESKRATFVAKSTASSVESLVKGDFPLAQPHIDHDVLDVHSATIPGHRIWLVGTIPEIPQEEASSSDEESMEGSATDGVDEVLLDDELGECCKDQAKSSSSSCTLYRVIKVFETHSGRWYMNSNETKPVVTVPTFATLQTALKRTNVIDYSNLPQDLSVYVNEKDVEVWNVEFFLLVLVQLVLLKASASSV
jgi:hypothetical protein